MDHIGIDLGGSKSQLCIRASNGSIVAEGAHPTHALPAFFGTRPKSRVIMETCAEAFAIADAARQAGHEVRIVPATLVRSLGVGQRGIKTDVRDARVQSEASCRIDLPSVHIPSTASRALKTVLNLRDTLIASRTQLINACRGTFRQHLRRVRPGAAESFATRAREIIGSLPPLVAMALEAELTALAAINAQVILLTRQLNQFVKADARCALLMSAPGVGPITAARFVSTIDDVQRFPDAHRVCSYLGLVPGESSSSARQHRTGVIKAGASATRSCLVQAAWSIWRSGKAQRDGAPSPIATWAQQIAVRRGIFVAVCAIARKLAGVLFAMWRDSQPYDSARLMRRVA